MEDLILALDYGGTKHTVAVLPALGRPDAGGWRAHARVYSPPGADAQYDLQATIALAHQLLAGGRPAAVGVSFGGPVDAAAGMVRLSPHVPGWEGIPLAARLAAEFGAPARVDNDANAAALGEHRFGAGRGFDSLCYITISTGVGGGWVLNGVLWRGAGGMAGEIGHTVVDPQGPACLCGKRGCVERLASGPYMAQDARERLAAAGGASAGDRGGLLLTYAGGDPQAITAQTLNQAAEGGDRLAQEVIERGGWALGLGIGNAANLVNPQRFILGGGVSKSGERWWEAVRRAARQTALPEVQVEIVPAALGDDAPLWGAAALAQDCLPEQKGGE